MTCGFCEWLSKRLGLPDCGETIAAERDHWERAHSNEAELWSAQPEHLREMVERAFVLEDSDPKAALDLYRQAAEDGSAWALETVGVHYETGRVVAADSDQALDFYHRAIEAGSWMATIHYARVLAGQGRFDACEEVLLGGLEHDFVPAFFWLASIRYRRAPTARTCRDIRPLLEHAAAHSHPEAQMMLARLMSSGKFGIRNMPRGLRTSWALIVKMARGQVEAPLEDEAPHPKPNAADDQNHEVEVTARVAV